MSVVNTDSNSYQSKYLGMCMETAEKAKKKNYFGACLKQCQHFNHFVVSVEVIIMVEAEATLKCISIRLAKKWKEPYLRN